MGVGHGKVDPPQVINSLNATMGKISKDLPRGLIL
jgi:hypothetical protein